MQDVACRIMVPIHHQPVVRAGVGAVTQRLPHEFATGRAHLRCIRGVYQHHRES